MKKLIVHIIESPGPQDFLNDRQEGHALRGMLELIGTEARVYTVVNKAMFTEAVQRIAAFHSDSENAAKYFPMLHISAHGDKQSIGFTEVVEELNWQELGDAIRPLNTAVSGGLLVAMSTCFGYEALAMAKTVRTPAFGILVGPKTDVSWQQSAVAFCSYYLQLAEMLANGPSDEAFETVIANMNAAAGLSPGIFASAYSDSVQEEWKKNVAKKVTAALSSIRRRMEAEVETQELQQRMRELAAGLNRARKQQ